MDEEIKIGRAIEEELKKEERQKVEKAVEQELHSDLTVKEDQKNILIMIIAIAGVFALILAGFGLYERFTSASVVDVDQLHEENLQGKLSDDEGYVYNGFSFVKVDGMWWTEIKRPDTLVKIPLHFGPKEVEEIEVSGKLSPEFNQGTEIYIAIDPDVRDKYYTLALSELSFNIAKGVDRTPIGACTKENYACDNRTIVSCENTQGKPVIELALENETGIEYRGSCLKIKGNGYELVKAANKVLYKWYGVME